jgi:pyruvate formate lyase activating enzyme
MLNVFNIQRYSIHDGEGIRTNIFFKGCPLRCLWCNNPESHYSAPSLMYDKRLCRGFGDCAASGNGEIMMRDGLPAINRKLIADPLIFSNACPSKALVVTGETIDSDKIISEVEKDAPFFEMCGGGVTLTGGEPLIQGPGLKELITRLRGKRISITIETSLHTGWETISEYLHITDMFLTDFKHTDPVKFSKFTGGEAKLVMDNLQALNESGAPFIVRVPVIPLFNHTPAEIGSIIEFTASLKNMLEIHLIPFNNFGAEKYRMLGIDYRYKNQKRLNESDLVQYVEMALAKGLTAKIVL